MNDAQRHQKSLLKVVVLGDAGVGKTSLVKQYVDGKFDPQYKPTIGADFLTKDINLPDRGQLKLQIWDTAGQERFKSIAVSFYRGADACVLVYDICDIKTFQNLEMWMKEFLENVGADISKEDFPFVVLGNKADKSEEMMVSKNRAENWCKSKKNVSLFETSALSKQNLNEAFDKIAIAAGRCLPSVALVDVQDLDVPLAGVQDLDDDKAVEDEPEQEEESATASEPEEQQYVEEEPRRAEIRRESPDESSKRGGRKKSIRQKKKKKSGRRSSIQGSHGSSKYSHKENQGSHSSSKHSQKERENRHQQKKKSARNTRRNSNASSTNSREDEQSRSSYESGRGGGGRHSRRSTPYRGRMDSIRLEEDDRYSTGSESPPGCCGL